VYEVQRIDRPHHVRCELLSKSRALTRDLAPDACLYNELDDGAYADLAALHRKLDETVCVAYGWPRSIAGDPDETNARLLALNQEIAAGKRPYDPFGRLHEPKS
jgi:hypothetical protein